MKNLPVILMLLSSSIFVQAQSNDCKALLQAIRQGNTTKVEQLLAHTNPNCSNYEVGEPRSPLGVAAQYGDTQIGELLFQAGARANYRSKSDASALMIAAENAHLDFTKLLLKHKGNVNAKIKNDGTPLMAPAKGTTRYLIRKRPGARPNPRELSHCRPRR